MFNEITEALSPVGVSIGTIAAAAFVFRHALSKSNLTTVSDAAQQQLVTNLQNEAAKWQKMYDEAHKLLDEAKETNRLLRTQNAMMRQLLISKGLTEAELTAIGAVEVHHGDR